MVDHPIARMKLDAFILDHRAQPRTGVDLAVVADYAEAIRRGDEFPPGDAFGTTERAFLASGWHRYHAARTAGCDAMAVTLHDGGLEEAIWFSCGTNTDHGLRRSNADKRRSVEIALGARRGAPDREIGRHCGVSDFLVRSVRAGLEASASFSQIRARVVERDGTPYVMDTSNIGRRAGDALVPRAAPPHVEAAAGVPFILTDPDIVPQEERAYYALSRQRLVVRLRPEDVADIAADPSSAVVGFEEFERWLHEFVAALHRRSETPIRAVQ